MVLCLIRHKLILVLRPHKVLKSIRSVRNRESDGTLKAGGSYRGRSDDVINCFLKLYANYTLIIRHRNVRQRRKITDNG